MDETQRRSAERLRSLVSNARTTPAMVRSALLSVPAVERDIWLDLVLGLGSIPADGPALPRGCVPYMPCPVDDVLCSIDQAEIEASDVFVDVGSGVGRSAALVHLSTGAAAVGIEIQPELVRASRELMARLKGARLSVIEGEAVRLAGSVATATVFFLYCPFGGARVERLLDAIEPIAHARPVRVCCVNVPLPFRPWLELAARGAGDVVIYRSTRLHES